MAKFTITGGAPLKGRVELMGAKNAGFKAMIATLLADSPSEIHGLGLISEIDFARSVIASLGGQTSTLVDPHNLLIDPRGLNTFEIPLAIAGKSRSTTMYVGPLLHRFGKAVLPSPGGDPIGNRPVDRHWEGLRALGATVSSQNGAYLVTAPNGLKGTTFRFEKNTHTGTETLILAAATASGDTILENAAAEPEVDGLITLLNAMGARILRRSPRTIKITGVKKLSGVRHTVMKDRIEAATFGCIALATKGDVTVLDADPLVLNDFLVKLNEVGGRWEKLDDGIRFWWDRPLVATNLETAPYPGFMTDWQPLWTTLMTQASGTSVVHETIFESRFAYVDDLMAMGGQFDFFNPPVTNPDEVYNFDLKDQKAETRHAVRIFGPVNFSPKSIEVADIRRGATVLLAGLMAQGETILSDPLDQMKRGYEDLPGRLIKLGAHIKVEDS